MRPERSSLVIVIFCILGGKGEAFGRGAFEAGSHSVLGVEGLANHLI